jgi:hypothetical protein
MLDDSLSEFFSPLWVKFFEVDPEHHFNHIFIIAIVNWVIPGAEDFPLIIYPQRLSILPDLGLESRLPFGESLSLPLSFCPSHALPPASG